MSKFVWSLFLTVALCDIVLTVPTGEFRIGSDLADLTIFREKQKLLSTQLSEFTSWTRNALTLVRSVAKAVDRAISEEFSAQLKQSTQTSITHFLRSLQSYSVQLQQYIDVLRFALPPPTLEQSKEFPEVYIYRQVFDTLRTTFSTLRILASQVFESYSYYVPEITLTRCMSRYLTTTYPDWLSRSVFAYPITFITYAHDWMMELIKTFEIEQTLAVEHKIFNDTRNSHQNQNIYSSTKGWSQQSNGIDSNIISKQYPYRVRESRRDTTNVEQYIGELFNFDAVIAEQLGWTDDEANRESIVSPTKCIQVYAVEALWDRLEKYLVY